jgi:hypothetical protein
MNPLGTSPLSPALDKLVKFDPPIPFIPYHSEKDENVRGVILSGFGTAREKEGPANLTHFFVMNADSQMPLTTGLRISIPTEIFDAVTGQWSPVPDGQKLELKLLPGGGKLLRLNYRKR